MNQQTRMVKRLIELRELLDTATMPCYNALNNNSPAAANLAPTDALFSRMLDTLNTMYAEIEAHLDTLDPDTVTDGFNLYANEFDRPDLAHPLA